MSRDKEIKKLGDVGNQKTTSKTTRINLIGMNMRILIKIIPVVLFLYFFISLTPAKAANPTFTLSAYLKPSTSVASKAIIIKNNEIRLATDASGYPLCQISNGTWQTAITSSIAIVVDKWQRVSCTYDGANLKIYVNGNLTGTRAETNVVNDTANGWRFGSDEGGTYGHFTGLMDSVKIYSRALNQREISYLYNQGKANAEWQFRANYNDTGSWCAENSLCKNLTAGGTGNTFGLGFLEQGTTALTLNGSGYSYIADDASLDMIDGQDFSISAWVKTTSIANGAIAGKRQTSSSSDVGYLLGMHYGFGAGKIFIEIADTSEHEYSLAGTTNIADGTWKNIIAVFDDDSADNSKIYINGKDDTASRSGTITSIGNLSNAVVFSVGAQANVGQMLTGSVDAVRVYKYALTAEDVKKEFNGGAPMRFGARSAASASAGTDEVGGLPPVAWWKFDEKSGTSAADNSGNGNTGTLGGGTAAYRPTWARGKNGNGLSFDGVDDYVDGGSGSSLNFGTNDFSISMWVYPKGSGYYLLNKGNTYAAHGGTPQTISLESDYSFTPGQVGISAIIGDGSNLVRLAQFSSDCLIPFNKWTFLVATFDRDGQGKLYANTILEDSKDISSVESITNVKSLMIGSEGAPSVNYWNGLIDDVRIYNYARTPRQIVWDFNQGKPSGWWKLDEGTGTSVKDNGGLCQLLSTYCHNGTIYGDGDGADWTTSGKFFNALDFVAANSDYVTIGDTNLNINSVSFWVNADSVTDSFIDLDGGTHKISVSEGDVSASGFSSPTYYINGIATASPTITASGWNHILVTTETAFEASNMVLGKISSPEDYFDGVIDDVRVYGYVRTAEDVLLDYNGSSVKF